jgi:hypothetical protein
MLTEEPGIAGLRDRLVARLGHRRGRSGRPSARPVPEPRGPAAWPRTRPSVDSGRRILLATWSWSSLACMERRGLLVSVTLTGFPLSTAQWPAWSLDHSSSKDRCSGSRGAVVRGRGGIAELKDIVGKRFTTAEPDGSGGCTHQADMTTDPFIVMLSFSDGTLGPALRHDGRPGGRGPQRRVPAGHVRDFRRRQGRAPLPGRVHGHGRLGKGCRQARPGAGGRHRRAGHQPHDAGRRGVHRGPGGPPPPTPTGSTGSARPASSAISPSGAMPVPSTSPTTP